MKYFTFSFRRLTAMLSVAMAVTAMAQPVYHYEVRAMPGQSIKIAEVNNHMYGLHLDEEDMKCIDWSAHHVEGIDFENNEWGAYTGEMFIYNDDYYSHNFDYDKQGEKAYYVNHIICINRYGTYRFVDKDMYYTEYVNEHGQKGAVAHWSGPVRATHILRVIPRDAGITVPTVSSSESTTEEPGKTAVAGGITTTESGISISLADEDIVDSDEGSVEFYSPMTKEEFLALMGEGISSPRFIDGFKGMFFKLPAGKGYVEFDMETLGDYELGVVEGSDFIDSYTKDEKGKVRIPYDLAAETWFYTFPMSSAAGVSAYIRRAPADGAGLKIYSLKVVGGGEDANVTIAKEGFSTYYDSQKDVMLPAGMKALIVTADEGSGALTYKTIADGDTDGNIVPAGTAVLLQTANSSALQNLTLPVYSPAAAAITETNLLQGSDVATTTTGGDKYYKLSYNQSGANLGWYWGAADGAAFQSGAHKAWLALSGVSAGVKGFFALPGDEETSINGAFTQENRGGDSWYDVSGRKLAGKPATKGLYINNGKKVVME